MHNHDTGHHDDARPHHHLNHIDYYLGFADIDLNNPCRDNDDTRDDSVYVHDAAYERAVNHFIDLCLDGAVPTDDPRTNPAAYLATHTTDPGNR